MVNDLNKIFEENSGNCPIQFKVFDPLDKIEVNMPSKTIKVELSNKLLSELDKFELDYRIK